MNFTHFISARNTLPVVYISAANVDVTVVFSVKIDIEPFHRTPLIRKVVNFVE